MRRKSALARLLALPVGALLCAASALSAHRPDTYQIAPDKTTMLVGEMRVFRMVDQNGRTQRNVTWSISNTEAFQSLQGDQLQLIARQAGDFRVTARTDFATADATVTVLEGSTLPPGTVRWSSEKAEGCQTVKIIQAVPSANGPAIYQQSVCEDGEYVAAYTANGVQLWRRKISDNGTGGASSTSGNRHEVIGKRLDARAASFCDLVVVGMEQQKIHELLTERNLTSHQEGSEREWLVEEASAQCRVWFDERLVVVKKEKVFVAD